MTSRAAVGKEERNCLYAAGLVIWLSYSLVRHDVRGGPKMHHRRFRGQSTHHGHVFAAERQCLVSLFLERYLEMVRASGKLGARKWLLAVVGQSR